VTPSKKNVVAVFIFSIFELCFIKIPFQQAQAGKID
jgi:hypothetical protein